MIQPFNFFAHYFWSSRASSSKRACIWFLFFLGMISCHTAAAKNQFKCSCSSRFLSSSASGSALFMISGHNCVRCQITPVVFMHVDFLVLLRLHARIWPSFAILHLVVKSLHALLSVELSSCITAETTFFHSACTILIIPLMERRRSSCRPMWSTRRHVVSEARLAFFGATHSSALLEPP